MKDEDRKLIEHLADNVKDDHFSENLVGIIAVVAAVIVGIMGNIFLFAMAIMH